jgi:indole-3-glycerol phosphate synthase
MTSPQPDLLAAIVAATRTRVATRRLTVSPAALDGRIARQSPPRGFRRALSRSGLNVIAECKRRSPSRGLLLAAYVPADIARGYASAGAAAVSVLTEPTFFDGALAHLEAVRDAVSLPILRKDFILDEYQVLEARAAGADAVLLIVAALDDSQLAALKAAAIAVGLDVLVEVHDDGELDRALAAGADLVGVNNRSLKTLDVDVDASRRLAPRIPADVVAVAESGLRTREDLERLGQLGYRAFLVGERLMATSDPGAALAALIGGGRAA